MANFLKQDTIIIGLPDGCVGRDIHLTGYRETNIIVLGEMFQPSYLPEIQIWLVSGYSRLIESRKKNESLQHNSTRQRCEILGEWTTIVSSKTWAGSATNMWTRCPRQAWPQSSLIIKHYRVQEGEPSTRVSKSLHKSGLALMKKLLLLEQINQWLGVLGIHIDWRLQVFKPQHSSHVCMTDLEWFQRKQHWLSRIHGGNLHQMHMN